MNILCHRGHWEAPAEKNALVAFERAFRAGLGIETDLRDHNGELVIAHDLPDGRAPLAAEVLALYRQLGCVAPLALNIKADGLQGLVAEELARHAIANYFVFDMAVPDALGYLRKGLVAFTRQSEVEEQPAFYGSAAGVWLDAFEGDWLTRDVLAGHLAAGKAVAIVSPELHGREPSAFWERLREWPEVRDARVSLCTDRPEAAREYFHA